MPFCICQRSERPFENFGESFSKALKPLENNGFSTACPSALEETPLSKAQATQVKNSIWNFVFVWKQQQFLQLKGKNPEGKDFRKLLRRKQSSAKISKISRNDLKASKSEVFYLLGNLSKYVLRTFFLPRSFQKCLPFAFFSPLGLSDLWLSGHVQQPPKVGFAKGGLSHRGFMKVCVERVQVTHAQCQEVSF